MRGIIILGVVVLGMLILWNFFGLSGNVIKGVESDFPETGYVSKVIDGDTVIINGESVRLLGIDCDERGYPCYNEAKKRIEELILDKEVDLILGVEDKDMYGRRLRYIFLNGKIINLQLVEEGLAVARFSPKNKKYKEEIIRAEKYARENNLGCKWREEEMEEEGGAEENGAKDESAGEKDDEGTDNEGSGEIVCSEDKYNCDDFNSWKKSQEVFDSCEDDVHGIDKDGDGIACEGLK